MNETKSSRYHRLNRRAGAASLLCAAGILGVLLWMHAEIGIVALFLLLEAAALPFTFYRSFILERRYELSVELLTPWVSDYAKGFALSLVAAVGGAYVVYVLIRWSADWWWTAAAASAALVMFLLATLAPIILIPLFYKLTPLGRASLVERLMALSHRAGVPALGVYEWRLGAKTRRANAALVGSGSTRRILISDTLLADYTEDEIEVILAHEMAHHVYKDISHGLVFEAGLLLCSFYAASVALRTFWQPLGLSSQADVAGLPLLLIAGGAVTLAGRPLAHAMSRRNERRADRFALNLTNQQTAFVNAMRRLALQNLAEESPSRAAVVLFHTHPPVEERIGAARVAVEG
ncbi:MAG: M48 family metalloprotease [Vicinamibacterales bacterium]